MGSIILLSVVLIAIFADFIAPYKYDDADLNMILQAPCAEYPFGTDDFGRDMLSRVIYGTRITLQVAVVGVTIQLVLGIIVGLTSGYFGGATDRILIFIADLTWCIPGLILALAVVTVLGKGLNNSIIAISIVSWAFYARSIRAKTMSLKNMPFVETGIAFGETSFSIIFRYIFPNIIPSVLVMATLNLPETVMSTTALSFLGLGSQPPSPDWGLALSRGVKFISRAPWLSIFPGLALVYTVFGFSLFGEGLRDILDPRQKSK